MSYVTEAIKEKVNPFEVLKLADASVIRQSGDEILFRCLNPDHNDSSASCYYNSKKHIWNCLGCDWKGDLFSLLMRVRGISHRRSVKILKDLVGISADSHDEEILIKNLDFKKIKSINQSEIAEEVHLPSVYETDWDKANKTIKAYVKQRRLSVLVMSEYFVGFCNEGLYKDRIILPIIHFDRIMGFVARAAWNADDKTDKRYLFEANAPVGEMLWGLMHGHERKNAIFVEGIFDALRLRSFGLNAYTTLSNNVTSVQAKLIEANFDEEIFIMPDNDAGGEIMKNKFKSALSHSKKISVCEINKPDPDELIKAEAFVSFHNSVSLTELNFKSQKNYVNGVNRKL